MANKNLFQSSRNRFPRANARNEAGGPAYQRSTKVALAQLAATGCFNGTFYVRAEQQLDTLRALVEQLNDNLFLAKLAVYARERAMMKDMPAALLALLSTRDVALTHKIFARVVDNGRVLRTLFQFVRSGQFGRKGLSSSLRRAFRLWLNDASASKLLAASIGGDPSLRDVLRMARPTPRDNARRALFGFLAGSEVEKWAPATEADLPAEAQALVAYRQAASAEEQAEILDRVSLRWDLLADAARGPLAWQAIARQMGSQALRMNLNTLARHDVIGLGAEQAEMVDYVAARIADAEEVRRSRQFPYQYLAAYLNASGNVPARIVAALQSAAELACGNIPRLPGSVVIGLDTSGSMSSPVSGDRGAGATSKMRCIDVAALFAAAILRRNPDSVVIPFDTQAYEADFDPSDSILSLADRLAQYGGGGTDCSLPLRAANTRYANRAFAGVVLLSDNESWVCNGNAYAYGAYSATGVMAEWHDFVDIQRRHSATAPKLVCIDLQPSTTTQAPERADILNVGGFSDAVFSVVSSFLAGDADRFVTEVEAVAL